MADAAGLVDAVKDCEKNRVLVRYLTLALLGSALAAMYYRNRLLGR